MSSVCLLLKKNLLKITEKNQLKYVKLKCILCINLVKSKTFQSCNNINQDQINFVNLLKLLQEMRFSIHYLTKKQKF